MTDCLGSLENKLTNPDEADKWIEHDICHKRDTQSLCQHSMVGVVFREMTFDTGTMLTTDLDSAQDSKS